MRTVAETAARYATIERAQDYLCWVRSLVASGGQPEEARDRFASGAQHRRALLESMTKTAVDPGRTDGWGSTLAPLQPSAAAFLELARSRSILGRLQGWRRVPFNVQVPRGTAGPTATWIAQGAAVPVTNLAFDNVTLGQSKVGAILVYSRELAKFSDPDAERLFNSDFTAAVAAFVDAQLVDPTKAANDDSPASITYGTTPVPASGNTMDALRADLAALVAQMVAGGSNLDSAALIMTKNMAARIALLEGVPPGLGPNGGVLLGLPVVTTTASMADGSSPAAEYIVGVDASEILLADGGIEVSASQQGTLQMNTAPDSPPTASTVTVPLWQHNLVGLKALRFVRWQKGRAGAGAYISGANYGG